MEGGRGKGTCHGAERMEWALGLDGGMQGGEGHLPRHKAYGAGEWDGCWSWVEEMQAEEKAEEKVGWRKCRRRRKGSMRQLRSVGVWGTRAERGQGTGKGGVGATAANDARSRGRAGKGRGRGGVGATAANEAWDVARAGRGGRLLQMVWQRVRQSVQQSVWQQMW
eukprot:365597-Chlamydomonas_euryale.AAC.1